jgi:hypothetical protein
MIEVRDAKASDFPEADALLSAGIAAGARVALDETGVLCAWGVYESNLLSDEGFVWLHVIDLGRAPRVRFLRECRRWIEELGGRYVRLIGTCESGNDLSFRWLKWLGFEPVGEIMVNSRQLIRMERCNGY